MGFCALLLAAAAHAQPSPPNESSQLPLQTTAVDDVVLPVPREIFATLDRFADSNWRRVQRPEFVNWKPRGGQLEIALRLGVVIAEGFIAVQAQDAIEVKSLGRTVLALARGLGVERSALPRSRSIVEHAEASDWAAVRDEWDHVLPDVQEGMKELRSLEMAQVVSLGGWLRGTEALTALMLQNYSPEQAELLRQPALLEQFERQLGRFPADIRKRRIISRAGETLRRIRTLLTAGEREITRAELTQINDACEELVKAIGAQR